MQVEAQSPTNLRSKQLPVEFPIQKLDSFSIVPGSLRINVPDSFFILDAARAEIFWILRPPASLINITYRVFPFNLSAVYRRFDYDSIKEYFGLQKPVTLRSREETINEIFDFGHVEATGSIGRDLGFGNAQDAVVNSQMNLQLYGMIGDSMELTAAISDNNVPFQPEGNTQNVSDFDRIYLQVKKEGWQVSMGDLDIRQSRNYFLNFYKRLQGVSFITENNIGRNSSNSFMVTGAVAKGKFARNILTPLEGNQGPYKLQGLQNEYYFVVLANTERVYIDGVLMQRGETNDYIINYNTAEVTFTARRLITKDLRIQVEFEYADRNFLNSQIYLSDDWVNKKKFRLYGAAFLNTDAKNSAIDQNLSADQRMFLSQLGDSVQNAFYKNFSKDSFQTGKILYERRDTIVNNQPYSIFVYSVNPNADLYLPGFTFVGAGKGNYRQVQSTANGKLFEWLPPGLDFRPQGDWEPVSFLVTPKKHQVFTFGADYNISSNSLLKAEVGISNNDVNLFSKQKSKAGFGLATRILFNSDMVQLGNRVDSNFLGFKAGWETADKYFKPIERLRNIEFYRDWGLEWDADNADENLVNADVSYKRKNKIGFGYAPTAYFRSDGYKGLRHFLNADVNVKNFIINSKISQTGFSGNNFHGTFFRPSYEIKKVLPALRNIETGIRYFGEFNEKFGAADTLLHSSFGFNVYEWFLNSDQDKLNKWGLGVYHRNDLRPLNNKLLKADNSNNIRLSAEFLENENSQLRVSATYRQLQVNHTFLSNQKSENTLLGRVDYNAVAWKGLLSGTVFYELGSGQEPRREFTYVEVQQGQGNYFWNDYNGNGIPELNEFEVAIYPDQKKYIRLFTPGADYIKADYLQFNYGFTLDPGKVIDRNNASSLKKMLATSQVVSSLQIGKKQLSEKGMMWNPIATDWTDSTLIQNQSFFSNSYFFNRTSIKWGFEITHAISIGKSLLSYGLEGRRNRNLNTKWRLNILRNLVFNLGYRNILGELQSASSGFENRNYEIDQNHLDPSLTYTYRSNWRAMLMLNWANKHNRIGEMEKAKILGTTTELKYNVSSGASILGRFIFNDIKYKGPVNTINSTIGYYMLDALMPGKNFLWNTEVVKRIGKNLELAFTYDGRQAAHSRIIHTGRASLKAIF